MVKKTEKREYYGFTSKELDEETGLYYFGARYFEPQISRWMSCDPALGDYLPNEQNRNNISDGLGGIFNPLNLNLYCYAHNNPIIYIDPDGEKVQVGIRVVKPTKGTIYESYHCAIIITNDKTGKVSVLDSGPEKRPKSEFKAYIDVKFKGKDPKDYWGNLSTYDGAHSKISLYAQLDDIQLPQSYIDKIKNDKNFKNLTPEQIKQKAQELFESDLLNSYNQYDGKTTYSPDPGLFEDTASSNSMTGTLLRKHGVKNYKPDKKTPGFNKNIKSMKEKEKK